MLLPHLGQSRRCVGDMGVEVSAPNRRKRQRSALESNIAMSERMQGRERTQGVSLSIRPKGRSRGEIRPGGDWQTKGMVLMALVPVDQVPMMSSGI